ncbi:MAG TPA: sigma 54-interacting transcriptional regulator [Planctomycetota bacterium]
MPATDQYECAMAWAIAEKAFDRAPARPQRIPEGLHGGSKKCRSRNGKGMTTALHGKNGSLTAKARVALVSRSGSNHLAAVIMRSGHEVWECGDWTGFAKANVPVDLVLYDEDLSHELPSDLSVPALLVTDRTSGAPARHFGLASPAAIESALEPLLAFAVELSQSVSRCRELERLFEGVRSGEVLVGNSPVMRRLQSSLRRAADCDATVLIEGPRGSGKSLAARAIHCKSRRSDRPILVLSCGETQAEALSQAIDASRSTTLVLEDIDRLPVQAQAILVRHLKERSATHVGSAPRLVATTSAHLPELVAKGAFREDLYYRLHALPILVPALRERVEDIALIAESILEANSLQAGRPHQEFTAAARQLLESVPWAGNVAQLELVVRRAMVQAGGGPIDRDHLLAPPTGTVTQSAAAPSTARVDAGVGELTEDLIRPFEEEEQLLLSRALRATKGNVRRAAQLLGIGRATLYRKIQQYRLRLQ